MERQIKSLDPDTCQFISNTVGSGGERGTTAHHDLRLGKY